MRHRGVFKSWNDEKGFGFVEAADGSADVFVHISAFSNRAIRPTAGAPVGYELGKEEDGRVRASKAWLEFGKVRGGTKRNWRPWIATFVAMDFIAALGVAAGFDLIHRAIPIAYATLSAATFAAFAWDKWRAPRNQERVAEGTLHLLEMLGGWPGGLAAQQWLRHKNRKRSYQIRFWIIVSCHIGLWAWLGIRKWPPIAGAM